MMALIGVGLLLVGAFLLAKALGNEHEAMDESTDLADQYETYYAELGLDKQFDPARPGSEQAVREYHDFMGLCAEDFEERMVAEEMREIEEFGGEE
jgi:hypothetical protein